MSPRKVRILHETNPRKYFPAIFQLAEEGRITLAGEYRYSVVKEWLRAGVRDRAPLSQRTRNAGVDLCFRLGQGRIRDEVILMGFAPWDFRIVLYRELARHNRILYHTSWHDWHIDRTPRQPRPAFAKRWLYRQWLEFVRHKNVDVVAVTPLVRQAVREATGRVPRVIPHAVPAAFFAAGRARPPRPAGPLRLLFVGEVAEKKGVRVLLDLVAALPKQTVSLTVVGDGSLSAAVRAAGEPVRFLGPIADRGRLSRVMGEHDVLLLLSQRSGAWEELFGIVLIEALAAGLGVIASDHVGPRGLLSQVDGAGLFRQDDIAGVFAMIKRLAADEGALVGLQQAQGKVARAFTMDAVARLWEEVITE